MPAYAILDINNRCQAVGVTSGELVDSPSVLPLTAEDLSLIGKIWNGSTWDDAAPVAPDTKISCSDFVQRLTFPEQQALHAAAETDNNIATMLEFLQIAISFDLASPRAGQAETYLTSQAPIGVLTAARIAEIFTP